MARFNPLGFFKRAGVAAPTMSANTSTAAAVSKAKGVSNSVMRTIRANPKKSMAVGAAAYGGMSLVGRRRGSGSPSTRRAGGIYKY